MSSSFAMSSTPFKQPSQHACLPCRAAKIKCKTPSIHDLCERCTKNSLNCVFEQHRRGRKPGTRLKRKQPPHSSRTLSPLHDSSVSITSQLSSNEAVHISPPIPEDHSNISVPQNEQWGSAGLQPVSILSKEVQSGKFSLGNILCVPDIQTPPPSQTTPSDYGHILSSRDDPIAFHILTFPVALGLFESFMRCLNPYISQLDPKLHTFDYIRQKSPFLLTTILSASSKAFHPSLHPSLRAHSEKLMGEVFVKGIKSVETVQGLLIFTYWKESDEMRTWLLVGYAIRMAVELNWHELEPLTSRTDLDESDVVSREARNIERTWLVLFVYDRSLSLQLGKPWMIEQNGIILKANKWYQHECAVPGGDLVLASFVSLRIISAEMLQLASPSRPVFSADHGEMLSKILNNGISKWEQDWLPLFDSDKIAPCHCFLANFYGLHLRLLLNSYSLQASLASAHDGSLISKSALWHCSSSAIGMLEQISIKLGPFKQLYFVQDSIHVMVAYAAIFLIKLLISLPKATRSDFEAPSVHAIQRSAETFEQQCVNSLTGCAMQARFLKSVIQKYESLKLQDVNDNSHAQRETTHDPASNLPTTTSDASNHRGNSSSHDYEGISQNPPAQDVLGTNLFADKDLWDNLFADVEFWVPGSISLSDNSSFI